MGNASARKLPLYKTLCKKESEEKVEKVPDVGVDDVFEEDKKRKCCPWWKRSVPTEGDPRVNLVLSFLYGTTLIGGVLVVALVPLIQLFKSPRKWCKEPLRTQDSSAEYCWLDLVWRTFPLTATDVIVFCAGLASFILGCLWFCCKTWRGRRSLCVVSILLVIVFLTEVITSIAIAVIYSQRQTYLPIELRKSIKQELYQSIRKYDSDDDIKNTWDIVQKSWCCCGVMEAVDWRNYRVWGSIPQSCAVRQRGGKGYSCFGYPWTHIISVDNPKTFDEETIVTTSRGCFELFAKKVGQDYVAAINVGWKVLLALSFLQLFGIIAPVVQACWVSPAEGRSALESCATEMTLAPSMSVDSASSQNAQNNRLSRQISQPRRDVSVSDSILQRQESKTPSAPPKDVKFDLGLQIC